MLIAALALLLSSRPGKAEEPALDLHIQPPTTAERTFDPRNPPDGMPTLKPGEAAVTQSDFRCGASVTYTRIEGENVITLTRVSVKTSLKSVIWLPQDAPRKLVDHEQAHRRIAEMVYRDAESVARELAAPLVGRRVDVTGQNDAAISRTIDRLMGQVCDGWMARIGQTSAAVNRAFDQITDHGRNKVDEADGIRKAFETVQNHKTVRKNRPTGG